MSLNNMLMITFMRTNYYLLRKRTSTGILQLLRCLLKKSVCRPRTELILKREKWMVKSLKNWRLFLPFQSKNFSNLCRRQKDLTEWTHQSELRRFELQPNQLFLLWCLAILNKPKNWFPIGNLKYLKTFVFKRIIISKDLLVTL